MTLFEKLKEYWWTLLCVFVVFALLWVAGAVMLEIHLWGVEGLLQEKFWVFLGGEMVLLACVFMGLTCVVMKLTSR